MRTFFHSVLSIITVREDPLYGGLPLSTFAFVSTLNVFLKTLNEAEEIKKKEMWRQPATYPQDSSFTRQIDISFCCLTP